MGDPRYRMDDARYRWARLAVLIASLEHFRQAEGRDRRVAAVLCMDAYIRAKLAGVSALTLMYALDRAAMAEVYAITGGRDV